MAVRRIPECYTGGVLNASCTRPTPTPGSPAAPATPPRFVVEEIARSLIVTLQLPPSAPQIGPDPSVNEWNMAVVGYPLWLWTEGPRQLSATRASNGITFTLDARLQSTTFSMGDGDSVSCSSSTPYPATAAAGAASPSCGYTYEKASLPRGSYSVTATSNWVVSWSAAGYSGTLPTTMTGQRELPVGELQAVVTG